MAEIIPDDIQQDLETATSLHQRATSDYKKCLEFNKLMQDVMGRLEDENCFRTADKVMGILMQCNPKEGTHCDNAMQVEKKMSGPLYPGKKS